MTPTAQLDALTVAQAARIMREATQDKSYQLLPLGQEAAVYLRAKRKRLTDSSYRDYESCLDKLARYFADLELEDLEPPAGTTRLEEFLDAKWGDAQPRTYNKNLSIVRDFLKFQRLRGRMDRDPTEAIERARPARSTAPRSPPTSAARSSPARTTSATASPSASSWTTGCARARCRPSSSSTSTTSASA
jgi:hypothetical protein